MNVTDDISQRLLRLPFYFEMRDNDINKVVKTIFSFYNRHGQLSKV